MESRNTTTRVAEMTADQLRVLIRETVKETLQDLFTDPDLGLALRPEFEERLRKSVDYVASGGALRSPDHGREDVLWQKCV